MGPGTQADDRSTGLSFITDPLDPGEEIEQQIDLGEWALRVTSNRVTLIEADRVTLTIPIADLRRIDFDIDRDRSGTLIIVPDESIDRPRVVTFGRDGFEPVGNVLVAVGRRLAG